MPSPLKGVCPRWLELSPQRCLPLQRLNCPVKNIERGIDRLQDRVSELEAFDVNTVRRGNTPELEGLEVAIKDTLARCFGENTSTYNHFQGAAQLTYYPRFWGDTSPDYIAPIEKRIKTAIALLNQAQRKSSPADVERGSRRL